MPRTNFTEEQIADMRNFLSNVTEPPAREVYKTTREALLALIKPLTALHRAGYSSSQIAGFFAQRGLTVTPAQVTQALNAKRKGKSARRVAKVLSEPDPVWSASANSDGPHDDPRVAQAQSMLGDARQGE